MFTKSFTPVLSMNKRVTSDFHLSIKQHGSCINVLSGFFDSLPAINTDTSLPFSLDSSVVTFPNFRYSFFAYYPKRILECSSKYHESIEESPYPYGYEHEECFAKHNSRIYTSGKNSIDSARETDKCIQSSERVVTVSYVPRSNSLIVKSSFPDPKEKNFRRFVFFKQTNKFIFSKEDKITWQSHLNTPPSFNKLLLSHLKKNNVSLYDVIAPVDLTVTYLRTILNNPFWKGTQNLYLLQGYNKKLKRKSQYRFKKNLKQDSFLPQYQLPLAVKDLLKSLVAPVPYLELLATLYLKIASILPEARAYEEITYYVDYVRSSKLQVLRDTLLIKDVFETIVRLKLSLKDMLLIRNISPILGDIPDTCTDLKQYFLQKHPPTVALLPRKVTTIGTKVLVDNPTYEELVELQIKNKFIEGPSALILTRDQSRLCIIFGNKVYSVNYDICEQVSLQDLFSGSQELNARGLNVKNKLESIPTIKRVPSVIWDLDNDLPF